MLTANYMRCVVRKEERTCCLPLGKLMATTHEYVESLHIYPSNWLQHISPMNSTNPDSMAFGAAHCLTSDSLKFNLIERAARVGGILREFWYSNLWRKRTRSAQYLCFSSSITIFMWCLRCTVATRSSRLHSINEFSHFATWRFMRYHYYHDVIKYKGCMAEK